MGRAAVLGLLLLAARGLSRGRLVAFPTPAHGVSGQSATARRIVLAFLADAARSPDTSSVAVLPIGWAGT